MKQYEDNQAFKQNIVDACKAIGIAYGKNRPENLVRIVIHRWW